MSIEIRHTGLDAIGILCSTSAAIDEVARSAILNAVESAIDMIIDCPDEYSTKQEIEDCLSGVNEMALDFVEDAIDEFKQKLLAKLRNGKVAVKVTAMHFDDKDGVLKHIDRTVNFE